MFAKKELALLATLASLLLPVWTSGPGGTPLYAAPSDSKNPQGSEKKEKLPDFYDVVMDPKTGMPRPIYSPVHEIRSKFSKTRQEKFLRNSRNDFEGDNAMGDAPHLLARTEYAVLKKGVEQRGLAIFKFLEAYYSGSPEAFKVIPKEVVQRIVQRNGETGFMGRVKPGLIAFPYGPDTTRVPAQNDLGFVYRTFEDNPGYIGGMGDLVRAREILFNRIPEYKEALKPLDNPADFYRDMVARARKRSIPPGGKMVVYMIPPYPDNEDKRLGKLLNEHDVEVVTPNTKKKLVTKEDGVYLRSKTKSGKYKFERVGFVFLDAEHKWIDPKHPLARKQLLNALSNEIIGDQDSDPKVVSEIKRLLEPGLDQVDLKALEAQVREIYNFDGINHGGVPGLLDALLDGKVATNYQAGIDFIGDKEFYTYVDDLVRYHLKEEPALSNIPTYRFGDNPKKVISKVLANGNYKKHVVKVVDGRGGDGVFIGPKMKKSEVAPVIELVKERSDGYIGQEFNHPAGIYESIVDIRGMSEVTPEGVFVSPTLWGRGVPKSGDGKVNLSAHGREYAVMTVEDPVPVKACVIRAMIKKLTALH